MIDYVDLKYDICIPRENLLSDIWKPEEDKDGRQYYWYTFRGVTMYYYPYKSEFTLRGKLITLCHNTQVNNMDDIYGSDTDAFITGINRAVNALFLSADLDIRNFYVMRIDYCFNVKTPYVREYLDFMSAAFRATGNGKRVNFTEEHDLSGSVYIKTRSDYDNNTRRNYVLNFYDKSDWLENKLYDGWNFSVDDESDARNILRLEAQCGGNIIKWLMKKYSINRTFGDMLSFRLACAAIERVYLLALKCDIGQDYYAYSEAKKLVPKGAAATALKKLSRNNKAKVPDRSLRLIRQSGVYPFHFIDKRSALKLLKNPLKLIRDKLESLGTSEFP